MAQSLPDIQIALSSIDELSQVVDDISNGEMLIAGLMNEVYITDIETFISDAINNTDECIEPKLCIHQDYIDDFEKLQNTLISLSKSPDDFKSVLSDLSDLLDSEIVEVIVDHIDLDLVDLIESIQFLLKNLDKNQDFTSPNAPNLEILQEFSNKLMEHLANNPELMYKVRPEVFERAVAEIFKKFNMIIHLTKRTHDGGIDIITFEETEYTQNKYIIECKKYGPNRKVGIDIVQRLYGIKTSLGITKAFLVTSSYFTKGALAFAKKHFWELDLKGYDDISKWLKKFWG